MSKSVSNKTTSTTAKSDNAIVKNLTKEEVAKAQETAQTRLLAFDKSFIEQAEKRTDIIVKTTTSKNNMRAKVTKDNVSASVEICRKENYIVCYTVACKDVKERKALCNKIDKLVKVCKTTTYVDSAECRIEFIIESTDVDVDTIVNSVVAIKKAQLEMRKKAK